VQVFGHHQFLDVLKLATQNGNVVAVVSVKIKRYGKIMRCAFF
jgi:hypothetical protein